MSVRRAFAGEVSRQACVPGRGREDGAHLCYTDAQMHMGGSRRQRTAWRQGGGPLWSHHTGIPGLRRPGEMDREDQRAPIPQHPDFKHPGEVRHARGTKQ